MKRLTSILTMLTLMLGLGMNVQAQSWEFLTVGGNDADAIEAEIEANTGNWYHSTASKKDRYSYVKALDKAAVTANGSELEYTKGLLFTITGVESGEGNLRAGNDGSNKRMWLNGGSVITIPNLTAGYVVSVHCKSSKSGEARGINAENLTPQTGSFNATSADEVTNVGVVTANGDVTLTMNGAMYIYGINVTNPAEGDEDEEGGSDDSGSSEPVTPPVNDYSTTINTSVNQTVLSLTDGSLKYYNNDGISSIDFDDNGTKVTINQRAGNYTFDNQVSSISFKLADKSDEQHGTVENMSGHVNITEAKGWLESAYVKFEIFSGAANYNVYVKGGQYGSYTKIDNKLVRNYGSYGRADAVGLTAGSNYAIKVVPVDASGAENNDCATEATGITVKSYSRQGFAFMGGYSPGAYNLDGTLKSNAKVFYVSKNTAKTISTSVITNSKGGVTECTGFQAIIDAYQKGYDTTPVAFRIIGLVEKDDLDGISSSAEGIQIKGKNADSEMPITIEGIGDDATIRGFGFLVRNSKGVEFRNFAVMRCMDDGISMDTDNSNIWVHHTDQFYGKSGSGDHGKGDGAVDVKANSKYVTVSYNRFWDTGKTNMFGMKSESGPNYISYDHNWFDHSDSRHPRVRTMSVHVWNNYFDNVAKYGVGATTGASVFVEGNYFLKTKKPILSSLQGTDGMGSKGTFSGEQGGIIKAYGNYMDKTAAHFSYYNQNNPSAKGYDAYEVNSRDAQVPGSEKTLVGENTYNNFDTNSSLMYEYTADAVEDVPAIVTGYYGAGRMNHGDLLYQLPDNVGVDDTDSATDSGLASAIDGYSSNFVGFFGDDNSQQGGGEQGGGNDDGDDEGGEGQGGEQGGGGDTPAPEGTIIASFDSTPSHSMFTVGGAYGDGKITYNGTFYKKGVKMNSSGSITFTPQKNYNMTLVLATAKDGRDVKINGVTTTVSGTTNTDGAYYQMEPIAVTSGTQYVVTKGSKESIVMLIILEPAE